MTRARKTKKLLVASDFAGDGEPYTEVTVTISIRILGAGITRSRLAVNVCPDPGPSLNRNRCSKMSAFLGFTPHPRAKSQCAAP